MVRMIAVGSASQTGTLWENTSPLNAVVARRMELRAKACSKGMCQFFELRGMKHPISVNRVCGNSLIRPGYDRHCVTSLTFVDERRVLVIMANTTGFRSLPFAQCQQTQHRQEMSGSRPSPESSDPTMSRTG